MHLVSVPGRGESAAEVIEHAERIYQELGERGVSVLYDDRDVSPGVKFADADLRGRGAGAVRGGGAAGGHREFDDEDPPGRVMKNPVIG